jgi:hypothetical protein
VAYRLNVGAQPAAPLRPQQRSYTPVIAVTAHDDVYDLGDLRFDSCRVKPVAWGELLRGFLVVTAHEASAST